MSFYVRGWGLCLLFLCRLPKLVLPGKVPGGALSVVESTVRVRQVPPAVTLMAVARSGKNWVCVFTLNPPLLSLPPSLPQEGVYDKAGSVQVAATDR